MRPKKKHAFALNFPFTLFCFSLSLIVGCSPKMHLKNQTFVFELGQDIYANPEVYLHPEEVNLDGLVVEAKSPSVSLFNNRFVSVNLEYLNVGEYDFILRQGKQEIPFLVKVKDTKPPTLQKFPASIEVFLGTEIDWPAVFEATDLSGVYYEAPTSLTSTLGEHEVDVKIRDRFGNAIIRHIRVVVKGG